MSWRNPLRRTPLSRKEEDQVKEALEQGEKDIRATATAHLANIDRLGYLRKEAELAQQRRR